MQIDDAYEDLADELNDLADGEEIETNENEEEDDDDDDDDDEEEENMDEYRYNSEDNSDSEEEMSIIHTKQVTSAFGLSVKEIFKSKNKPKRIRRGRTAGKILYSDAARPLAEAYEAYAIKDYAAAASSLSECVLKAPRLPDPYLTMAMMHEENGNIRSACQMYLVAAVNSSTKTTQLWRKVIDLSISIGEYNQAIMAINRLIRRRPSIQLMHMKIIVQVEHAHQEKKASMSLERLIAAYPNALMFRVDYADRCYSYCWYDRAASAYLKFICAFTGTREAPPARIAYFNISEQYDALYPDDQSHLDLFFHSWRRVSNLLADTGNKVYIDDTYWITETVIKWSADFISFRLLRNEEAPTVPVDVPLMQSWMRLKSRRSEDIIIACKTALPLMMEEMPSTTETSDSAGIYYIYTLKLRIISEFIESGMKSQAMRVMKSVLGETAKISLLNIHQTQILNKLGQLYLLSDEFTDAADCFESVLKLDKQNASALIGLFKTISRMGGSMISMQSRLRRHIDLALIAFNQINTDSNPQTASFPSWRRNVYFIYESKINLPDMTYFTLEQLAQELKLMLQYASLHTNPISIEYADIMLPALLSLRNSSVVANINTLRLACTHRKQLIRVPNELFVEMSTLQSKRSNHESSNVSSFIYAICKYVKLDKVLSNSEICVAADRLLLFFKNRVDGCDEDTMHTLAILTAYPILGTSNSNTDSKAVQRSESSSMNSAVDNSDHRQVDVIISEISVPKKRRRVGASGSGTGKRKSRKATVELSFVDASSHDAVIAASKHILANLESIKAANDLCRAYYSSCPPLEILPLEASLPIASLRKFSLQSIGLALFKAHSFLLSKKYLSALRMYLNAYSMDPLQPLVSLCIHTLLLHLSLRETAAGRHELYSKSIAFLLKYAETRVNTSSNCNLSVSSVKQEVMFNHGRTFHEAGLFHLAEKMYREALGVAENDHELKYSENVTLEAAYNLVQVYRHSRAHWLALEVMKRHLTFDEDE